MNPRERESHGVINCQTTAYIIPSCIRKCALPTWVHVAWESIFIRFITHETNQEGQKSHTSKGGSVMNRLFALLSLVAFLFLWGGTSYLEGPILGIPAVYADDDDDEDDDDDDNGFLVIEQVALDPPPAGQFGFGQLTITGEHFEFKNYLAVTLGPKAQMPSALVMVFTSDMQLIYDLPKAFPDGDYLLTVSTGKRQRKNDEYDLTIGAVGPPGPPGAAGMNGMDGMQGDKGDPGTPASALRFYQSSPVNLITPNGDFKAEGTARCDTGDQAIAPSRYEQASLHTANMSNTLVTSWNWSREGSDSFKFVIDMQSNCTTTEGCPHGSASVLCLDLTP